MLFLPLERAESTSAFSSGNQVWTSSNFRDIWELKLVHLLLQKKNTSFISFFFPFCPEQLSVCVFPSGKCFLFRSLQRAGVSLSEQAGSISSWEESCKTSLSGVGASLAHDPRCSVLSSSEAWWTPSIKKGTSHVILPWGSGMAMTVGEGRGLRKGGCSWLFS